MSDYKLEFTLRQHTPLIHFQGEQHGATLRATELKPKLDRFLLEKEPELIRYKKGKEGEALDYKIRITVNVDATTVAQNDDLVDPLYFAGRKPSFDDFTAEERMEKEEDFEKNRKKFSFNKDDIVITISSFKPDLLKYIQKYFPYFMARNNFGTRQSKGFGSFFLNATPINEFLPSPAYYFEVPTTNQKMLRSYIDIFYRFIRSGINHKWADRENRRRQYTIFYAKSLLWDYARTKNITWDKKAIKSHFFSDKLNDPTDSDVAHYTAGHGTERLVRDMLGLSSEQSWYSYRDTVFKKGTSLIEDNATGTIKPKITRFKSPITFKPILTENGYRIYFYPEHIPASFKEETFQITTANTNRELPLQAWREFDLNDYLDHIYKFKTEGRLANYIEAKYHSDPPDGVEMPATYRSSKKYYEKMYQIFNSLDQVARSQS
jgi:hypothetical protein